MPARLIHTQGVGGRGRYARGDHGRDNVFEASYDEPPAERPREPMACGSWPERDAHAANEKSTFSGNTAGKEEDVWKEGDGGGGNGGGAGDIDARHCLGWGRGPRLARNVKMTHETGHGVRRVRGRVRLSIFGIYRSLQPQSSLDPRPSVARSSLPFFQRSASATHPHDSIRLNVLYPTISLRLARPSNDPRPLLALWHYPPIHIRRLPKYP